ncbi:MAG: tetratricopeptide repeat protein [Alphaproteobacteria bacterium]
MTTLEDTRSGPRLRARDRWRGLRAVLLCSAAVLAGCASINPFAAARPAPSVSSPMTPQTVTNAARASAAYERDPKNANAAVTYARALREFGSNQAAADLLSRAAQFHPDNGELVSEYAKSLTAAGQNQAALPVFAEAKKLNKNDWSLLSAEGIALDQLGHHDQARGKYGEALRLSPNNPDVLCNLAFSYTLTGELSDAEVILRKAAKDPDASTQVRQNLAMVVGLQGRFTEAQTLARADLDPVTADHNVAVMRQMYAQPEMWASAGKEERGPALASNAPANVMADASSAPDDKVDGDKASDKKAAVSAVPEQKASAAKAPDAKPLVPTGVSAAVRPAVSAVPAKTENDLAEPAVEPGFMQKPAAAVVGARAPSAPKPAAPSTKQPAAPKPAVGQHVSTIEGKGSRMRQQFAQSNAPDETFFAFN